MTPEELEHSRAAEQHAADHRRRANEQIRREKLEAVGRLGRLRRSGMAGETMTEETCLPCRFRGCTALGTVVIVTWNGFCFERCPTHARQIVCPA